ncbi:hypothetical protein PRNP1_010133 [Phytophthora ramorum]
MFRVPEPLRAGVGLRLALQSVGQSSGEAPSVYVSEVLPRSIYDFTHISLASDNASAQTESQVVEVDNPSFSGDFWVVVHSEYLSSNTSSQLTVADTTSAQVRNRRLADSSLDSFSFQLVAEQYELPDSTLSSSLLTDQSFAHAIFSWVFDSSAGIAVFTFAVALLVIALGFCAFRVARAPENQDKVLARLYPSQSTGAAAVNSKNTTPGRMRRASGALIMDIEDVVSGQDIELSKVASSTKDNGHVSAVESPAILTVEELGLEA